MIDLTETLSEFIFKGNYTQGVISNMHKGINKYKNIIKWKQKIINFNKYIICHYYIKQIKWSKGQTLTCVHSEFSPKLTCWLS